MTRIFYPICEIFKMKYIFIGILLFFLISCGNSKLYDLKPFDAVNFKDQEPINDHINNPIEVTAQSPIIGYFDNKNNIGDKDYYKVIFPFKGTSYKFIQTAVPGIDSKITFFSASKRHLLLIDNGKRGEFEKLWQYYPNEDSIIMLVESKTGFNKKVPYVIEFYASESSNINEAEPNNRQNEAMEIRIGEEIRGLISPKDDFDYYKVIFDDNEVDDFSIKVKTFSNLDINFSIYDLDNNTFKIINSNGWGQDEYFPFLSNGNGNYVVKVGGNTGSNDRKTPIYSIKLEEISNKINDEETHYEKEFNDESDESTELIDGIVTLGVFYPKDDIDWYKYDVTRRAKSVNLSLSSIKGIKPKIEIYNNNMELLETYDSKSLNENSELLFNNVKKGAYYVKLSSSEDSQQIYKLYLNIRY